ncbi:MAG: pre-peptidase C-terminal domain-containing protein [Bacteroidota bacterium]
MKKNKAPKICFDRLLPGDLVRPHAAPLRMAGGRQRAIALAKKEWVNGSTIHIGFLGGTAEQQQMVRSIAPEWTEHANLRFEFTDDPRAEIRVSFDPDDGAWSYIGTDNSNIPLQAATLNLGWQDKAVILHEFGHMIGLAHEHQNPEGGLIWNEEVVIRDLSGPPNRWDLATIRHNVLDKYSVDQIMGTEFDPASIMLYAFPDEWTKNPGGTHENVELSRQDKAFISGARMYPRVAAPEVRAVELPILAGTPAAIGQPGEEDLFKFQVKKTGKYLIETSGGTDLVMTLFGPGNLTRKLLEDDDSGAGNNPQISAALQPGVYYARVRHYSREKTGAYDIRVTTTGA